MNDLDLAIVMPIYNEEANIERVVSEWSEALQSLSIRFRLLALNDGSTDRTLDALKRLEAALADRLEIIDKSNSGHGRTVRMGYDRACELGSEWVLQIDSDGQCDPKFFPELWRRRESADCVFGYRHRRDDGLDRVCISFVCRSLTWLWTGQRLRDANVPYRLMRTPVLASALKKVPADFDIQNVAVAVALKRLGGLRWEWVPIHFRDRAGGTNSINIPRIVRMGVNMLRELKRVRS